MAPESIFEVDLDELEYRVQRLEQQVFSVEDIEEMNHDNCEPSAWDKLASLEEQVSTFENILQIDVVAMARSEESLQHFIHSKYLSLSESHNNLTFPFAVPLNVEAQRSIVQEAQGELMGASQCLATIFKEPHQLNQYVDSKEIRAFSEHTQTTMQLELKHNLLMKEAADLSQDSREFIHRYASVISLVNEKCVSWESALKLIKMR